MSKIKKYANIVLETNPSYWITYTANKVKRRKERDVGKYKVKSDKLHFEFLKIQKEVKLISEQKSAVIALAESICEYRYTVFGVEIADIRENWTSDPETSYVWENKYYADLNRIASNSKGDSIEDDIKFPWELCSMHFLVTLAQAYAINKNEKYVNVFLELLADWDNKNPVGYGVNWCCTMDVAIRAINIIVGMSILNAHYLGIYKKFEFFIPKLYEHMLFIRDNLEYGLARENHYLSDIVGLKMIAQCFQKDKRASKIYEFASKQFLMELLYEVCKDGVDNEASTCYHALVFELFLIGIATDSQVIKKMKKKHIERIHKMCHFTEILCGFEKYPVVGDNDSGHILDLNGGFFDRRELVYFCREMFGFFGERKSSYSSWIETDIISRDESSFSEYESIESFTDGGFCFVNCGPFKMLFHAGSIGRKGMGSHGHNDQLSFVMDVNSHSFFIDPGSYVYKRNPLKRHYFRSTVCHNTPQIGEYEQNDIWIKKPFKMDHQTFAKFVVADNGQGDLLQIRGWHEGYTDKAKTIVQREISIDSTRVLVTDNIKGSYVGSISMMFVVDPEVDVRITGTVAHMKLNDSAVIFSIDVGQLELIDVEYSREYNQIDKTKAIKVTGHKMNELFKSTIEIKLI